MIDNSRTITAAAILSVDAASIVQAWSSLLGPADVEVVTEENAGFLLEDMREAIKDRRDGLVDDDIAFTKPWGFELSQNPHTRAALTRSARYVRSHRPRRVAGQAHS